MTTNTALSRFKTTTPYDNISADIGLLILRVVFGGLLAAHGSQKLFGWFDGFGLTATQQAFDGMGYNPGKLFGTLAGLSEFTGGLLLLLGLVTPLASAIVVGTMINAVNATWVNGLFGGEQPGYEMALLYATVGATVAFTGAGKFSLDGGRPWQRQGLAWGIGAIAIAVVAAVLTLILKWVL